MLERRQLHRILAHETWLFGEDWALTGDDERPSEVLKKHLKMLDEDVELATVTPIKRDDGREAIPDLVLGRTLETNRNEFAQLVVELKRPSHRLRDEDVSQFRSYAQAIVSDERFAQPNVKWDFWLVGNEVGATFDGMRRQPHLPFGVVQTSPFRLVVKQWAEVLSESQHRLRFVHQLLQYESDKDSGLAYTREKYARFLPDLGENASDIPPAAEPADQSA